jgi:hypothetical protein
VNTAPLPNNEINMRSALCSFAVALLLASCGSSRSTAPRARTAEVRPGHARVSIADRISWPYRLDRVLVVMDGVPVLRLEDGDESDRAAVELPLVAGVHTIAVQIVAALPSGSLGSECLVRLRTAHSFGAGHDPISIVLVPFLGDQTAGFAERLELEIRFEGTRPIAEVEDIRSPADAHCAELPRVDRLICLAEALVAEARRQRDVIAVVCQSEKLELMHRAAASAAPDRAARVEQLWLELTNCVGCPKYVFGPQTERMAYSEGCGPVDDLLDPDRL